MMRRFQLIIIAVAALLTGCDEGRIYPQGVDDSTGSGLSAEVELSGLRGASEWPSGYSVVLAGFVAGKEYAVVSKNLDIDAEGNCRVSVTGIPAEVSTVELCVIDRLRRRIASFASVAASGADDLVLKCEDTDVSPAAAIQTEIFNTTCTNCHGGASFAAAGLNLTEGRAFDEMIGRESVKIAGKMRVEPGNADESVLWMILGGSESADWAYDHSVELATQQRRDLIKNWINSLKQ